MAKTYDVTSEEYKINELLKAVIDPELNLNIVDLGLVYNIEYAENKTVKIEMTLSTPACPLGDVIMSNVQQTIQRSYTNYSVEVELVWEPAWSPEMVSPEGKNALNLF